MRRCTTGWVWARSAWTGSSGSAPHRWRCSGRIGLGPVIAVDETGPVDIQALAQQLRVVAA